VFGLQCKSTLTVVALTLAVAGPIWWFLGRSTTQLTKRIEYEHCTQLAALLARTTAPLVAALDLPELQRLVDSQVTGDPLLFLQVTDTTGKQLAADTVNSKYAQDTRAPAGDLPLESIKTAVGIPSFRPARETTPPHLDVIYPMVASGDGSYRHLGYIRLGVNLKRTMHDLESAMDLVSGVGIGVVLLIIPLSFLVVRQFVLPLEELSRAMRSFAQGDLTARSCVRRSDEIGALTTAFNQMAEHHARTHAEALALNVELEERVQQRTRQLRELACRDPLTGLYNRRHLNDVLTRRMSEAERYDTELACLMIDIDDFKLVNDRFGHAIGDQVLSLAASTIMGQLRVADVAARFGGDEFVILLPQTGLEQARSLAERISEKLAAELDERMPEVRMTLSTGIASRRDMAHADAEMLLKAADRAMYDAKGRGKNQVCTGGEAHGAPLPSQA
jgi:diguanylate cyclase (GGDEF)-like protein